MSFAPIFGGFGSGGAIGGGDSDPDYADTVLVMNLATSDVPGTDPNFADTVVVFNPKDEV